MANLKPILYGAGAFALIYGAGLAYRQYTLITNSDYSMKNVKLKGIDLRGVHLTAEIDMNNKSNIRIEVYSQNYDIYFNDIYIGKITNNIQTVVPPKGIGTFGFNIDVNPALGLKAGVTALQTGSISGIAESKISIKGTMMAKTSGILFSRLPIDLTFKVGDYLK